MATEWKDTPVRKIQASFVSVVVLFIIIVVVVSLSIVYIGGDEVGIVEKKFAGGALPAGQILAVNGENGIQAQILAPGWHLWKWPWQYNIDKVPLVEVREGTVGLIQAADGQSLPPNTIYAPEWTEPKKMLDAAYFLGEGKGYKGPQLTVLKPGKYRLNTKLFTVEPAQITDVKTGSVAVIKSNVGEAIPSEKRLVEVGQRGIWNKPFGEGQYYLHTKAYEVTIVDIQQVMVSYTPEVDKKKDGKSLTPIVARTKDGFTFPVDVRVTYQIESKNAPQVVADVGDNEQVLDKLVTPAVREIFRNNAEKVKALEYVQLRSVQGEQSTKMLQDELTKYGVTVLAVRISDVGDEESLGSLLKTQTDREIALQEQETFQEQQRAAEQQKELKATQQEAEEEMRLATAEYGVKIAEQEKLKKITEAEAQAKQVTIVAEAQAKAYQLIADVIGPNNAALVEIMKLVSDENIKITPEVMVSGSTGSSGMTDALMGTILQGMLNKEATGQKPPAKE